MAHNTRKMTIHPALTFITYGCDKLHLVIRYDKIFLA